jgi:glucose-1-phosphate thymidylyltransferase
MRAIIFEDGVVDQLAPISWTRPAYAISCGGTSLLELVAAWNATLLTHSRPHLQGLWQGMLGSQSLEAAGQLISHGHETSTEKRGDRQPSSGQAVIGSQRIPVAGHIPAVKAPGETDVTVWINARMVPSRQSLGQLQELAVSGRTGVVRCGEVVAAAIESAPRLPLDVASFLGRCHAPNLPALPMSCELIQYAHDVLRFHESCLQENLEYLVNQGEYHEIADDVFAASGVTLGQFVISDTTNGPVVLEQECIVEPYSYLCGPLRVGEKAKVRARAQLRGGISIGYGSRVGGEVQTCVIEAYSNKQHDGFLGHSYLGSWVNLGANTCVSNLKNTYGEISVEFSGKRVPTGMSFLGAILGDFAKTAIQTSIFSGKLVGPGSMLYGAVTENVGSFVNYAKQFGDVTAASLESVQVAQDRMMKRRGLGCSDAMRQLMAAVFALTEHQRKGLDCRPPRF